MNYPRPITSIHQIEMSSRCNLRCVYCPSKDLDKPVDEGGFGRAKLDISQDDYGRALEWCRYFDQRGTQNELALTGIGEALLHPDFEPMLAAARRALPGNLITLSTNGLTLAKAGAEGRERVLDAMQAHQLSVYVSLHRPEKAKIAIDLLNARGLLADTNAAFATNAFDWAGQLDWAVSIPEASVTCEYLRTGWAVVLADGRVTTCCLDASGASAVGHVDDPIGSLAIEPWKDEGTGGGCEACHMNIPAAEELVT